MFAEPLDVFMNPADFAKSATLNGFATNVIFDEAYMQQLGMVEDFNPFAHVKTADVTASAAVHGSLLVIGARTFKVREIQPDGNGMTVLQLSAI
jgi:hypothetical protein